MADEERTPEAAAPVTEAVSDAASKMNERLGVAREKLGEVAQVAQRKLGDAKVGAGKASEVARERYDTTVEQLKTGYDKVRKDYDSLSADVNEYVRDNPGKAVLIAAGFGFLVGLLIRGGDRRG